MTALPVKIQGERLTALSPSEYTGVEVRVGGSPALLASVPAGIAPDYLASSAESVVPLLPFLSLPVSGHEAVICLGRCRQRRRARGQPTCPPHDVTATARAHGKVY